ncbi:RRP1 family protein [Paracoccus sp. MA]|uniref:RRP1 family protein n=1 Tax=Paracoccus sp. MA TaxID=2895796 RepID=UPI001E428875|nr:RRP1 family protein [Paracoccus sp. MA]UFM66774.1 RRP1 family protein [Paracoccus sp. MA]
MLPDLLRHYNSSTRPAAFAAWAESLPRTKAAGSAFWSAAVAEWSGFDRIDHYRMCKLFRRFRSSRPASLIERLPDKIRIYRGQDAGDAFGLAWSTDRTIAEGFAEGHRGFVHDDPYVYEITVSKEEVAFCCDNRGEAEIVLLRVTPDMVREAIDGALSYD